MPPIFAKVDLPDAEWRPVSRERADLLLGGNRCDEMIEAGIVMRDPEGIFLFCARRVP